MSLVTAAVVAQRLGVSRGWVYEHAAMLGVRRLGSGPKARLRFDLEEVDRALRAQPTPPDLPNAEPTAIRRRRSRQSEGIELLPILGRRAA
jgi:hypothetical protein